MHDLSTSHLIFLHHHFHNQSFYYNNKSPNNTGLWSVITPNQQGKYLYFQQPTSTIYITCTYYSLYSLPTDFYVLLKSILIFSIISLKWDKSVNQQYESTLVFLNVQLSNDLHRLSSLFLPLLSYLLQIFSNILLRSYAHAYNFFGKSADTTIIYMQESDELISLYPFCFK